MSRFQVGLRYFAGGGLSLLTLGLPPVWGQSASHLTRHAVSESVSEWVSTPQLRADLDTLFQWIEKTHPQPFAHNSRERVLQVKREVSESWHGDSVHVLAAAQGLTRFCRTFQDSHTGLRLREWLDGVAPYRGHLPLKVQTIAGQTLIQSNSSGQLPPGAMLRSIEDRGASVAWQWAFSLVAIEGEGKGTGEVASVRADRAWPLLAGWAYGLKPGTSAHVVAEWQGNRLEAALPVAPSPPMRTRASARKSMRSAVTWEWGIDNAPAYLKISHFPYHSQTFERQLHRFFRGCERRDVQAVVLDLRDNPGGSVRTMQAMRSGWGGDERVWPGQLQVRSTPESWATQAWVRKPRNARKLARRAESDEWAAFTLGLGTTPVDSVWSQTFDAPLLPARRPFTGATAVLIDGTTASAATTLAAWLAHSRGALLVGGPALGSGVSTWGQPVFRNLPSTGWPVMISTGSFYNLSAQHSLFPLLPQLPVAPVGSDFASGRDAAREAAVQALLTTLPFSSTP
jgi:hypothetical protein